ncbi:MAG TPA: hypothetical protein VG737_14165 [Cyclobacteriaceae bacterium]|nr:hypothetical protein [Cyclobacteriaceae bacterium]
MKIIASCIVLGAAFVMSPAEAQLLNRLKQKAESKVENKADATMDKALNGGSSNTNQGGGNTGTTGSNNGMAGSGSTGNTSGGGMSQNQGGAGLNSSAPDVNQNLSDADAAYKSGKYGEARYSVQQAMLGVELQIGNNILKSLPETINSLPKDAASDQVTSTGSGWAGLTIVRRYTNNNNKDFKVTIANSAMMMAGVNAYFNSVGYAQQTGGQQNWKQTKLKGNRAIIEFNEGSGYKLSVPLGQSTLAVFEGVSFANENEMMSAANTVDVDAIKKMLGEQ